MTVIGEEQRRRTNPATDQETTRATTRRTGHWADPWLGRAALVLFAAALFVWPSIIGDPTRIRQWAEYLCYAMIAVGLDIAWGYGGMLALGQGVFFGLGAYAMGMHLSLEQVAPGHMPHFMALYSNYTHLPLIWRPFASLWFAAIAAVAIPMIVAGLLGWLVFARRIRGPYFALLTQATALVFWLVLIGQLKLTAGTNGLTDFAKVFGRSRYAPGTNTFLFAVAAVGLFAVVVIGRALVRSRFGRLLMATRDGEDRVRFLGFDPALVKTVAFVVAAGMAGLAGAIAAPVIGIVAPDQFTVLPSIIMLSWVAVGGRGTLWGPVLGALLVGWGKTTVSEAHPQNWVYFQGLLFIGVVAFLPGGLAGLAARATGSVRNVVAHAGRARHAVPAPTPATASPASPTPAAGA